MNVKTKWTGAGAQCKVKGGATGSGSFSDSYLPVIVESPSIFDSKSYRILSQRDQPVAVVSRAPPQRYRGVYTMTLSQSITRGVNFCFILMLGLFNDCVNEQGGVMKSNKKLYFILTTLFALLLTAFLGVEQAAAQPLLVLDKSVYNIGEAIEATFSNGPANATDWVGIYRPGQVPGNGTDFSTLWLYVGGTQTATDALDNGWVVFDPGLTEAGSWWAGFFANDGYALLDSLSFTVVDPSGIREDASAGMPETLSLNNYPNPFNSETTIVFTLPREEEVTLKIHDLRGKTVAIPVQRKMPQGKYTVRFSGDDLASGLYCSMLQSGREVVIKKMLLLR